jgi:hypothetical protein
MDFDPGRLHGPVLMNVNNDVFNAMVTLCVKCIDSTALRICVDIGVNAQHHQD